MCECVGETRQLQVLLNQLLRSGTSVGANIREANYAASRADFINKLQIALKECYESEYWLELLNETQIANKVQYEQIYKECRRIRAILISAIKTAKSKNT